MKRLVWLVAAPAAALMALMAQDATLRIQQGLQPALAVPDLRGAVERRARFRVL
jgi:hypothetical protein